MSAQRANCDEDCINKLRDDIIHCTHPTLESIKNLNTEYINNLRSISYISIRSSYLNTILTRLITIVSDENISELKRLDKACGATALLGYKNILEFFEIDDVYLNSDGELDIKIEVDID